MMSACRASFVHVTPIILFYFLNNNGIQYEQNR